MIHPFLQEKFPQLFILFNKHKVTEAHAFGSVCTNYFNDKSDVDLLVDFDKQLSPEDKGELMWNLWDETEKLLNRKVDLVSQTSLTNPFFIEELNETKQWIYGKTG